MASGDTKTEALLNVLGNGGDIEGITGSGNTKTQDYLVDAIERLQKIEDEISGGGGGGGGSMVCYLQANPSVAQDGVTIYSDVSCTTPISLRTFFSALRDGKTVWVQYRTGSGEYDNLYSYQIVSAMLTNVDTEDAYNEVEPFGSFFDDSGTMRRLGVWELDPDATTDAFRLS